MAEVRVAARAQYFDALHAVGFVLAVSDTVLAGRFKEAGPAAVARELRVRPEQPVAAHRAVIRSPDVDVPVLPRERLFGTLFARHLIEVLRKDLFPGGIRHLEMCGVTVGIVGIVLPRGIGLQLLTISPKGQGQA